MIPNRFLTFLILVLYAVPTSIGPFWHRHDRHDHFGNCCQIDNAISDSATAKHSDCSQESHSEPPKNTFSQANSSQAKPSHCHCSHSHGSRSPNAETPQEFTSELNESHDCSDCSICAHYAQLHWSGFDIELPTQLDTIDLAIEVAIDLCGIEILYSNARAPPLASHRA